MTRMNKDDFLKYRLDMLETRLSNIEKRIDSMLPNNGNNINMELLKMVMSMVKEPKVENKVTCVKEIVPEVSVSADKEVSVSDSFNLRRRSTII